MFPIDLSGFWSTTIFVLAMYGLGFVMAVGVVYWHQKRIKRTKED